MTYLNPRPHGRFFVDRIAPALIDSYHGIPSEPFQRTACWPQDVSALIASNSRKASLSEISADQP